METLSITPEYTYKETISYQTIQTPYESGATQLRAKWPKPKRRWSLNWKAATPDEVEEMKSFFRAHSGPADTFSYSMIDYLARPYCAPTLGQTSGGALGNRIRYASFTWSDDSDNETEKAFKSDLLNVSSGYLLTVTVPEFPNGVDKACVYVGTTSSALKKQATAITTSGGTWTEPAEGFDSGGDSPPTSNSLAESATVHFVSDSLEIIKLNAYAYSMAVVLEEVLNV